MEYYRHPVAGSGNTARGYAPGTNFVLQVGQCRGLALPVSEEGESWNVYFDFERTGLRTELADYLQKPRGAWVGFLPQVLFSRGEVELVYYLKSNSLQSIR